MWTVTVYRDNGFSGENYSKQFDNEEDAYEFFDSEIRIEFEEEIEQGLVSDNELQNIINAGIYTYENDAYEVTITLETYDESTPYEYGKDQDYI